MAGLDDIIGGVLGGVTGQGSQGGQAAGLGGLDLGQLGQLGQLAGPIMALIEQFGGLQGLLDKLQSGGLGDIVGSWLGSGANSPISADQITAALGSDQLSQAAGQAGISVNDLAGQLGSVLPGLTDQLSPNGQLPGADQIGSILGGLFGGK